MTSPTARQLEIHTWMLAYQREHGTPPSTRVIADHFGIRSTTGVHDHMRLMAKKGLVRKGPRSWTAIDSTPPASEPVAIQEHSPRTGLSRAPAASPLVLRPMSEAPTTGPVVEVLVATTDRAGCEGWLIGHYADGGGEDQPRFRGWFFWTGHNFRQIDERTLLGWLPLPTLEGLRAGGAPQ